MLTVIEHMAIVQRAQAIAATDNRALVQVQASSRSPRVEVKRLRQRARRCAPAISGRWGLGRMQRIGR